MAALDLGRRDIAKGFIIENYDYRGDAVIEQRDIDRQNVPAEEENVAADLEQEFDEDVDVEGRQPQRQPAAHNYAQNRRYDPRQQDRNDNANNFLRGLDQNPQPIRFGSFEYRFEARFKQHREQQKRRLQRNGHIRRLQSQLPIRMVAGQDQMMRATIRYLATIRPVLDYYSARVHR